MTLVPVVVAAFVYNIHRFLAVSLCGHKYCAATTHIVVVVTVSSLFSANVISNRFGPCECFRSVLGLLCNQGEEQIMSSVPDSVQVLVANDLLAVD